MLVCTQQPAGVDLSTKSSTLANRGSSDNFARPSLAKMSTRLNSGFVPADLKLPFQRTLQQQQVCAQPAELSTQGGKMSLCVTRCWLSHTLIQVQDPPVVVGT